MRKPIILGNWKMHKTLGEAIEFIDELKTRELPKSVEAGICAPFIHLSDLVAGSKDSDFGIGAENGHYEDSGAFTGEVSIASLADLGVDYVIIGHSERRQFFAETDEAINKKILKSLEKNVVPVVCVGESLEEREDGSYESLIKGQIEKAFMNVTEADASKVVVAYEPIWAIGTGKSATSKDANEMCKFIRETIKELYSDSVAEAVRIQYGGSVKPENITEYMVEADIDGALVGGASLEVDRFIALLEGAKND